MKKIISVLMMSVFLVTGMSVVLPYNAYAQTYEVTKQNGDVKAKFWYYIVDDHAEIEVIRAYEDELTIPAEIEDYPVKVIRKGASISDNKELKSLNIEDGIEEVNLHASYCPNLVNVHLPDTLKSGDFSFFLDTSLESITIPGGLEEIPLGMCNQCVSLKNVTIENGVKIIGKQAFFGCDSLERITLPDSVYLIDDSAFSCDNNLKKIKLSDNLEYINESAFYKSGLEKINLPNGLKEIGQEAFGFTPLKEIKLPDSLEKIGYETFKGCTSLTKAYIPKGIGDNPNRAFYNCPALTDITIDGEMTKALYEHLTADTPWGKNYDRNVTDDFVIFDGNYLAKYKGKDKNPVIPDNVTVLGEDAFKGANIDTVTFSPNIKEIPSRAFAYSNIKEVVIPSTIKKVSEYAFLNCTKLDKITVEEGVEKIDSKAFMNCYTIHKENIHIPESVKVASDAFKQTPLDGNIPGGYDTPAETPKPTASPEPTGTPKPTEMPVPTPTPTAQMLTVESGEEIKISVNGKNAEFDVKPFIDDNGRTQIPVRAVAETLDCKVDWNQDTKTAVISKDSQDTVKITLDSDVITVNDKQIKMDTAALLKGDRTFVPVRFIAEALGLTVEWVE